MSATLPRLKMCKRCDSIAISYDGKCAAHAVQNGRLRNYSERPMPSVSAKNPFGMEIECIDTIQHNMIKVEKFACYDSSINSSGGVELKFCSDVKKIGDKGADVAQRARIAGGRITNSCGFHVHMSLPIDFRTMSGRAVYRSIDSETSRRLYPYLTGLQSPLFAMMPNHRRDNEYCRALNHWEDFSCHHSWIAKSCTVPTVELRIHPGTLNPWKVKAWAEVCKGLQSIIHSVIMGEPSEAAELARDGKLLETFKVGSLARKYLDARTRARGNLQKFGFDNP